MNPRHSRSTRPFNSPGLRCRVCHKPVAIDAAKTDRDGKAIHDECYVLETNHENASDGHVNEHKRPWPVVAKELSNEQDPAKVIDLAKELIKAFDEDATLKAIHQKPPDVQERAPKFKSNARHT